MEATTTFDLRSRLLCVECFLARRMHLFQSIYLQHEYEHDALLKHIPRRNSCTRLRKYRAHRKYCAIFVEIKVSRKFVLYHLVVTSIFPPTPILLPTNFSCTFKKASYFLPRWLRDSSVADATQHTRRRQGKKIRPTRKKNLWNFSR